MLPLRPGGLLLVVVVSSACFSDGGPGDSSPIGTGSGSTVDASSGSGSGAASDPSSPGSATTTDAASTSSSSSTTDTTSSPTTTDPGACAGAGEPCGAGCCGCLACAPEKMLCEPVDAECGTCEQCDLSGACVLAPPSTTCATRDATCEATIWGPFEGVCYAYAGALGECDAAGECLVQTCDGMGAPAGDCPDVGCFLAGNCVHGEPVDAIEALCATDAVTPDCRPTCEDAGAASYVTNYACDASGDCIHKGQQECGGFKCTPNSNTCAATCSELGCAFDYQCVADQCVPF